MGKRKLYAEIESELGQARELVKSLEQADLVNREAINELRAQVDDLESVNNIIPRLHDDRARLQNRAATAQDRVCQLEVECATLRKALANIGPVLVFLERDDD